MNFSYPSFPTVIKALMCFNMGFISWFCKDSLSKSFRNPSHLDFSSLSFAHSLGPGNKYCLCDAVWSLRFYPHAENNPKTSSCRGKLQSPLFPSLGLIISPRLLRCSQRLKRWSWLALVVLKKTHLRLHPPLEGWPGKLVGIGTFGKCGEKYVHLDRKSP